MTKTKSPPPGEGRAEKVDVDWNPTPIKIAKPQTTFNIFTALTRLDVEATADLITGSAPE